MAPRASIFYLEKSRFVFYHGGKNMVYNKCIPSAYVGKGRAAKKKTRMHKTFIYIFIAVCMVAVPGVFAQDAPVVDTPLPATGTNVGQVPPIDLVKPMPAPVARPGFVPAPAAGPRDDVKANSGAQNEFLEMRKEYREGADMLKNEYLDAKGMIQRNAIEVRNEIRNEGKEDMLRVREEVRNEVKEMDEAKKEGAELFLKARTAALEEAKKIHEESKMKVEALRKEALSEVQKQREEFLKKIAMEREQFTARLEEKKTLIAEKFQEERAQFEMQLQKVRDEKKQEILSRVNENMNELNARMLGTFSKTLEKLESVLVNIATRADKAEAGGRDVSAVRSAIDGAKNAIDAARRAIEAQMPKVYTFTVTTEDALKSDVGIARDALKNDLQVVRSVMEAARTAVHNAATTLAQIPNVNGYEFETSSVPASQNIQSEQNQ